MPFTAESVTEAKTATVNEWNDLCRSGASGRVRSKMPPASASPPSSSSSSSCSSSSSSSPLSFSSSSPASCSSGCLSCIGVCRVHR